MKVSDLTWTQYVVQSPVIGEPPDINWVSNCFDGIHRFSVLYRMTGFSFGRDTETALLSIDRSIFWLRSGWFDIREHGDLSIDEAIVLLKSEASNYCQEPRETMRDREMKEFLT